jgi:hypothetical protein
MTLLGMVIFITASSKDLTHSLRFALGGVGMSMRWIDLKRSAIKKLSEWESFLLNNTGEEGFEPPTPWSVATCSSPLSYTPLQAFYRNTPQENFG